MHVVVLGNGAHVIKIPIAWGADNVNLKQRMQNQESRLFHMLKTINKLLTKRKNSGEVIYYLDTMPVYINSAGTIMLTNGLMYPTLTYEQQ